VAWLAGLRVVAGPLAGALRVQWRTFLIFNALGAVSWVAAITTLAYVFGNSLEPILRHFTWAIGVAAVLIAAYWWVKRKRRATAPR
jgi:membrane protein DedA with SNARE-associated domain